ncbi:hypothetical protein OT109_02160 [Phycisphaeraceae bacterium D3-23]
MNPADPMIPDVLYPLSAFEATGGGGAASVAFIEAEELTPPYRSLLAHDRDMTGTLEAFFGQPMNLRVRVRKLEGDALLRQVTLVGADDGRLAEFGAIRIDLSCFDGVARGLVIDGRIPLGRILREHGVAYISNPSAYLKVTPGPILNEALQVSGGPLYGRKNQLTTPTGQTIAHIIEILPPLSADGPMHPHH